MGLGSKIAVFLRLARGRGLHRFFSLPLLETAVLRPSQHQPIP